MCIIIYWVCIVNIHLFVHFPGNQIEAPNLSSTWLVCDSLYCMRPIIDTIQYKWYSYFTIAMPQQIDRDDIHHDFSHHILIDVYHNYRVSIDFYCSPGLKRLASVWIATSLERRRSSSQKMALSRVRFLPSRFVFFLYTNLFVVSF